MSKTLKKTLSIILTILMIAATVPLAFAAEDNYEASLKIGDETTYHETVEAAFEAADKQSNNAILNILKDCTIDSDVTVQNCFVEVGGSYTLTNNAVFTVKENGTVFIRIEFINNGTINNYRRGSEGFCMYDFVGTFVNNGTLGCNSVLNRYGKAPVAGANFNHTYTGTLNDGGNRIDLICDNCEETGYIIAHSNSAAYTGKEARISTIELYCPSYEIVYTQNGVVKEPVKVGKYLASVTIGGVTATAELEIVHPEECVPEADDGDCTTPIMCAADCGAVLEEGNEKHMGGTATCIAQANCDVCGTPHGEFDKANHTGETEIRDAVAATEDSEGYTGNTYCLDCGEKIADGEIIPKLACEYCDRVHTTAIHEYICYLVRLIKIIMSIINIAR